MCGCAEALVRAVVAFFDAFLVDGFLFWFRRRRPAPAPTAPPPPTGSARAQGLDRGGAPGLGRRERCPGFLGFAESTLSNQQLADGDDTDEELRREVIVVKAVTGRRGGFGTRPMI
ncbi:uncharacterized protein [Aegilops tauschii subsp. strangulata]|uniref:uncharacterized protein isoform X1 n=1 Tax=Aegilops tauschii subsp. strangulata TaxID=200361 RepID=UPI003CC8E22E